MIANHYFCYRFLHTHLQVQVGDAHNKKINDCNEGLNVQRGTLIAHKTCVIVNEDRQDGSIFRSTVASSAAPMVTSFV